MGSLTNTYEDFVLNHLTDANVGGGETPPAADCWVGLWMGDPTDTGAAGTGECDYTSYAREQITFSAAASRKVVQSGVLTFTEATGAATTTVDYWGIFTAESGGTMMAHGQLAAGKTIVSGNTPSIATTEIEVEISAGGWHDDLCHLVLNWLFRQGTFSQPANLYVALCKAELSDSFDMSTADTELDMTGYAREAIPKGSTYWNTVSGGATDTKLETDFGTLTSTGETVTAVAICASGTKETDDCYMWSNAASQAIGDGDDVTFPAGDINLSCD